MSAGMNPYLRPSRLVSSGTRTNSSIVLHRAMRWTLEGKNSREAALKLNEWLETAVYIKNNMKTEPGLKMAKERFGVLERFITALNRELPPRKDV